LALRENAPGLDVQLDQAKRLIRAAGVSGIYLSSLHKATGMTSNHIMELLENASGVECVMRDKRPLYRLMEKEESQIQDTEWTADELETVRDELLKILGSSTRNSHWLVESCHFSHAQLLSVSARYPADFEVQQVDTGVGNYFLICSAAGSGPATRQTSPADAGAGSPVQASAPQAAENLSELLEEIFPAEQMEALKFKPACVGMGSRRNGPIRTRDHRVRTRFPLVQL
jgi:hypothetical protein